MENETKLSHEGGRNFDERASFSSGTLGGAWVGFTHKDRICIILASCEINRSFNEKTDTHAGLKACVIQVVYNLFIVQLVRCTGVAPN